jgi:hypothetical protein
MPSSTINYLKEKARQRAQRDDKFLKRMLYFFELRLPYSLLQVSTESFLFPLVIPPESYAMDEPFTAEITPTQGGGVYVEENGIVQRSIHLRGHTGFKPRPLKTFDSLPAGNIPVPAILNPKQKSFSRSLPTSPVIQAISGHRHFQYLQDSVFRTYADLKRDPATSEETVLIFHNPKDDEHWVVIPQKFTLERDSSQPFLYRYNIELLAVDTAEARDADFSEDKNIFDKMKDTMRSMKRGVDLATGALHDLTAIQAEAKAYINNVTQIIDSVTTMLSAASDFINGVTDLIQTPLSHLTATVALIDEAATLISTHKELGDTYANFPEDYLQKLRQMADGLEQLGTLPATWETPTEATLRKIREQQDIRRLISSTRKSEAIARSVDTLEKARALGTNLTYGDIISAEGTVTAGNLIRRYKSGRQVTINEGDTLVSLAARYLGDARLWQYIAIANGLKPPFIDEQANAPLVGGISDGSQTSGRATGADEIPFDRTLGVGSKIVIPSNTASSLDFPLLPVLGAQLEESTEDQFLGTDTELIGENDLTGSDRVQYDIPIDSELGSVDVKLVSGMRNLSQVILTRLRVERGTDLLYQKLGTQRIVGLGATAVNLENARFRVLESLASDSRISGITNVDFDYEGDALSVDLTVQVRGFSDVRPLRVLL